LTHRFYLPGKELAAQREHVQVKGKTPEFRTRLEQSVDMITMLAEHFVGMPILVVCDRWFGNNGLFAPARRLPGDTFHPLSRLRANIVLYAMPEDNASGRKGRPRKYGERIGTTADAAAMLRGQAASLSVLLYGRQRDVLASSIVVMLKTLRCPVRLVFVYRRKQWVAMFTTDLSLSVRQIIEFYGARWKIESGFKEIKRDIGAGFSQMRNAQSVINHLNFCMMAAAVTWLYAIRLEHAPERRHMIRGRSSFAFSDVRHIIAKAALSGIFDRLFLHQDKPVKNLPVAVLLRIFA